VQSIAFLQHQQPAPGEDEINVPV